MQSDDRNEWYALAQASTLHAGCAAPAGFCATGAGALPTGVSPGPPILGGGGGADEGAITVCKVTPLSGIADIGADIQSSPNSTLPAAMTKTAR